VYPPIDCFSAVGRPPEDGKDTPLLRDVNVIDLKKP